MAEGVLFNVAEGIIGQLGNLALKEIGLIWGVKDELQKLKNTVTTIKAVLQDAEEHQALSNAIKDWVERLKDVFFEADDLLDDFFTEVLQREVMTRNKKAKEKLEIVDCPILAEGCKSEDWLAHIQNLKGDLAPPKEEESEQNEMLQQVYNSMMRIINSTSGCLLAFSLNSNVTEVKMLQNDLRQLISLRLKLNFEGSIIIP
ncbi:hypothetical protein CMV_021618 [Castanea mollissima]|uniref:Disease resistance N-terminal domain-containing protein n=1 Tax=Castanea mollissima TaxID=60419 RepID=A0A8J4QFG3_9ROSI|nr:hypothetical protein CMV_021618 [Castanea mollissima]